MSSTNLIVVIEDTEDFLKASDVIYERLDVDDKGFPRDYSFGCPYAVLACYTIESGIKNLLIHFNVPFNHEHDLLSLFDLLPSETKRTIYKYPNSVWNTGIFIETPEEIFRSLLSKTENIFKEARYFFETKNRDVEICVTFLHSTSHLILDTLKEVATSSKD